MGGDMMFKPEADFKVSFGYQCNDNNGSDEVSKGVNIPGRFKLQKTSSFSCLSGAALSANATLANTNICNGLFGEEILPSWDSPNSFRRVPSSPALSKLDILSSSLHSSFSNLSYSPSYQSESNSFENDSYLFKPMSAPSRNEGFLNSVELQVAGGAAGEDRVQAVCSEENGWLFCGIYDGFNGRDAADFLAGTLYDTIVRNVNNVHQTFGSSDSEGSDFPDVLEDSDNTSPRHVAPPKYGLTKFPKGGLSLADIVERPHDLSQQEVLDSLQRALSQAEKDFLYMVEQEMDDRPDLVSVGSCVLVVLLHGDDLYTVNLGDSRAVLATYGESEGTGGEKELKAVQLNISHTVDNEAEKARVLDDHPDDPMTIVMGKVKGKLKVTRAIGVGYLKKKHLNDALMGILRVRDLRSPPYISAQPSVNVHKISKEDHFVVVASDGLFDFFSNDEVVKLVHSYILNHPSIDPAKLLLEQLISRAANNAGFSTEELINVPAGRRRKYHDDVTVIVIILGTNQRTSRASTWV